MFAIRGKFVKREDKTEKKCEEITDASKSTVCENGERKSLICCFVESGQYRNHCVMWRRTILYQLYKNKMLTNS